VDPAGACLAVSVSDRERVIAVDGLALKVALGEADGAPAADVDGGDHLHRMNPSGASGNSAS